MLISVLKSKIHRAIITAASLDYQGSLSVPEDLMTLVGLLPYERILCSNLANGHRFETYAIAGPAGSGEICLNGATAHLGKVGNRLVIMSFIQIDPGAAREWHPKIIVLGEANAVISQRGL